MPGRRRFWGGVVPGSVTEIPALAEAGVFGFKVFLAPSGVDEFGHIGFDHLEEVLAAAARYDIPLLVHAKAPGHISPVGDEAGYASYLASRPPIAEIEAVQAVVEAARRTGGHAHVLHASAAGAVAAAAAARKAGHKVTVETCPHYLALTARTCRPMEWHSNALHPSERRAIVRQCGAISPQATSTS